MGGRLADEAVESPLELVAAMSHDFAASLDVQETLARGLERVRRAIGAEGGALFLLEDDGRQLVCEASVGPVPITGLRLPAGTGIVGQSVRENTCRLVRDVYADPNFTPSVDQKTGFTTRSILCAPMSVKGERLGAIELVNKQGGDGLFSDRDLHALRALAASAALAVLNARLASRLVEQERVRRELELAAEIQRGLLPAPRPASFPIHGRNFPARKVSGDFFDFFDLPDGRYGFCVGDVAGKGINAALLMARTSSLYRCLGRTLVEPGRLLEAVNREICETATRGLFVSLVGGVYDPRSRRVRLANAGHEPPLLQRADGDFVALPAEAPPLGIPELIGGGGFEETEVELDGGRLYVFTDGVTEGLLPGGSRLGVEGLRKQLTEHVALPAPERLEAVLQPLQGETLHDDLTLLVVEAGAGV